MSAMPADWSPEEEIAFVTASPERQQLHLRAGQRWVDALFALSAETASETAGERLAEVLASYEALIAVGISNPAENAEYIALVRQLHGESVPS